MKSVSTPTIMIAIQALLRVIEDEERAMVTLNDEDEVHAAAGMVETYRKSLNELRGAYETALEEGADLPPFAALMP